MDTGITPLTPAEEAAQEQKTAREGYVHRVAVAVDQGLDVACGGSPDETISSRFARAADRGSRIGILGCKFLNLFQKNHGAKAQAGDVERAKAVIEAEKASGSL